MATWAGDFSRKWPADLLEEARERSLPGLAAISAAQADVLLLTDIDYDAGLAALRALNAGLAEPYPHLFAARPNTGMATGRDLDGDGRLRGPRDAQGYGWFAGQGGQAILSRWPLRLAADHSEIPWRDVPDTAMAADDPAGDLQRLSSSAHWAVSVEHPVRPFTILTVAATPPVFDGPEDRNGRRNRDEVLLWLHALDGALGPVPGRPLVLLGNLNLDPDRGDGLRAAARRVLAHPALRDPLPGRATVDFPSVGPMRVSYALPSRDLRVADAGVMPAAEGAGPHGLVWVDLLLAD